MKSLTKVVLMASLLLGSSQYLQANISVNQPAASETSEAVTCTVKMSTEKAIGEAITFWVNHSESPYKVDWGDGNVVTYQSDAQQPIFEIAGKVKGKNLSITCDNNWFMLDVQQNGLTQLDLSGAKALRSLFCAHNALTSIDLTKMTQLCELDCADNQINKIVFTDNNKIATDLPNIIKMDLSGNQLTGILRLKDVKNLQYVDISNNQYEKLYLEKTNLQTLLCSRNKLTGVLSLNSSTDLRNVVCNDNKLSTLTFDNSGATAERVVCDNNMSSLLNLGKAENLSYLSCTNNKLKNLILHPEASITALNLAGNQLKFSALPGKDKKPQYVSFLPQDSVDISKASGMMTKDNLHYAPVANSWSERNDTYIDLGSNCKLADKSYDADIKWFRVLPDGTTAEMTECTTEANGDFYTNEGKVSFFKGYEKAFAKFISRTYGFELPSKAIRIGDELTGIEQFLKEGAKVHIAIDPQGLLLSTNAATAVSIFTLEGKSVWKGIVKGQQYLELAKGIYIVNGQKIIL